MSSFEKPAVDLVPPTRKHLRIKAYGSAMQNVKSKLRDGQWHSINLQSLRRNFGVAANILIPILVQKGLIEVRKGEGNINEYRQTEKICQVTPERCYELVSAYWKKQRLEKIDRQKSGEVVQVHTKVPAVTPESDETTDHRVVSRHWSVSEEVDGKSTTVRVLMEIEGSGDTTSLLQRMSQLITH